jgi:hypothetical protein
MRLTRIVLGLFGTALTVPLAFAQHSHVVEKSKIVSNIENRVAVVKVGTRVCRHFSVGISERNWVKGDVSGLEGDEIIVTVDDPGHILLEVNGSRLEKGARLKEPPSLWTPCF